MLYRPNMINNCIMWILTVIGIGWIILTQAEKDAAIELCKRIYKRKHNQSGYASFSL